MSSLGSTTLSNLLGGLLAQAPMVVWVVGLLLAITRWSRHPRASALLAAGLALHIGLGLLGIGFNVALPWLLGSFPGGRAGYIVTIVTAIRALIGAVAWGLVLAAVFANRSESERG